MGRQEEDLRRRYLNDAVQTASPAARLGMLYDRLQLDLSRADAGFESNDMKTVNDNLIHAQEILLALHGTLQTGQWEAASNLAALYMFIHGELVGSNLDKDRQRATVASTMVAQLADAFRQAAETANASTVKEGALAGGVG
jgi:flagellar secretion chaperone FliS